jgi:hypothetical protein
MSKVVAVNYSAEQTARVIVGYTDGVTVENLAAEMGKSVRSIIAKLSREGVYKKKEYVTKAGEPAILKDAHADAIGSILNLSEPEITSLTKCNKAVLRKVFEALANSKPIDG